MKKYAVVLMSAAFVLMLGIGSASAQARSGTIDVPERDPNRPDIGQQFETRKCEQISSDGTVHCTFCWHDHGFGQSICDKYIGPRKP